MTDQEHIKNLRKALPLALETMAYVPVESFHTEDCSVFNRANEIGVDVKQLRVADCVCGAAWNLRDIKRLSKRPKG